MHLPFLHRASHETPIRPNRHWFFILGTTFILLILSIGWNLTLFLRLTRGETLSGDAASATSTSSTSIQEIQAAFEQRAAEATRYKTEYQFIDPSRSGG